MTTTVAPMSVTTANPRRLVDKQPFNRSLVFSCAGHVFIHMLTAYFFVVVLAIEADWGMPYAELIELWTLGAFLVGAAALPAGWLADRWGAGAMMAVFFVGLGACTVLAGFAGTPGALMLALAGMGLFAAIYHPVGIPWLIRHSGSRRGKILAVNGIFGSLGAALAGVVAGGLIDLAGWRVAYVVPGVLCAGTGLLLMVASRGDGSADANVHAQHEAQPSQHEMLRVFGILLFTMFCGGIIYHSVQTALPKLFEIRVASPASMGALGVGSLVAVVYTAAGVMQLIGGHLADRYPLRRVYVVAFLVQAPLLWMLGAAAGLPLVVLSTLTVMAGIGALPAENMLLARYTPARRHGVVFGLKFVLAFGAAPLAVQLVSMLTRHAHGFEWLFLTLCGLSSAILIAALLLPGAPLHATANPRPALD